ncbi:MAG TPA: hypothetical protein PKZ32_01445 [Candidatus Melainabacteria bacterium]|nr:hypothetical protein [Candidatus Melainabacteria bacterium]
MFSLRQLCPSVPSSAATAARTAFSLLIAIVFQPSAHCQEATPSSAGRSTVSQASIQDHYERRFAQRKERKIKALQLLMNDGSAPVGTVHSSSPLPGLRGMSSYRVSSANLSRAESKRTNKAAVTYVQPPVTYVFQAGQGYGVTSHFGPPQPGDVVFQYDPGGVLIDRDLPSGVANAIQAENHFNGAGVRITDTAAKLLLSDTAEIFSERILSPDRWVKTAETAMQANHQLAAESTTAVANQAVQANLNQFRGHLVNVANEAAAGGDQLGTIVARVQMFWKNVYLPMSILLLITGATLTFGKVIVQYGFNQTSGEEVMTPLAGPLKAITAICLIPATQLIVSYSIDIGNSLTDTVQNVTDNVSVTRWLDEQGAHAIGSNGTGQTRTAASTSHSSGDPQQLMSRIQNRPVAEQTMGMLAGSVAMMASMGTSVLLAFQLVFMLYLFLMGPISAALYTWPWGVSRLFKSVFSNWLNAVINLALWRFWWSVLVLVMDSRVRWLREEGIYQANSPWELAAIICFLVLLSTVPFMAFQFNPGSFVDKLVSEFGAATGKKGVGATA